MFNLEIILAENKPKFFFVFFFHPRREKSASKENFRRRNLEPGWTRSKNRPLFILFLTKYKVSVNLLEIFRDAISTFVKCEADLQRLVSSQQMNDLPEFFLFLKSCFVGDYWWMKNLYKVGHEEWSRLSHRQSSNILYERKTLRSSDSQIL